MGNIRLSVKNVTKKFSQTKALEEISFDVFRGDFIVLGGSNGSGKSVLMSLLAELDVPSKGEIILYDENGKVGGEKPGLVFQDADAQILGETPEEDVAFGAKNFGFKGEALKNKVSEVLEKCGLSEKKGKSARTMSGGEKRRLAVAGILAMDRDFLIFDEPFANLDWPGVKMVTSILKELKEEGKTIIVLTHEIEKVLGLANRFIVLDKGILCFDGTPEEGLKQDLAQWSIKNPLSAYSNIEDLVWI